MKTTLTISPELQALQQDKSAMNKREQKNGLPTAFWGDQLSNHRQALKENFTNKIGMFRTSEDLPKEEFLDQKGLKKYASKLATLLNEDKFEFKFRHEDDNKFYNSISETKIDQIANLRKLILKHSNHKILKEDFIMDQDMISENIYKGYTIPNSFVDYTDGEPGYVSMLEMQEEPNKYISSEGFLMLMDLMSNIYYGKNFIDNNSLPIGQLNNRLLSAGQILNGYTQKNNGSEDSIDGKKMISREIGGFNTKHNIELLRELSNFLSLENGSKMPFAITKNNTVVYACFDRKNPRFSEQKDDRGGLYKVVSSVNIQDIKQEKE